ncbi:hypothetical protein DMB66_34940 [Actinoplanes sp. ATCC 53533]|uniref:hypothetical protein n=1 Tax=Actinoplanes sp. ATCC 53533 TaxID=1288362 RepID=UPI000F79A85B|nr:hypothetical protein [Actinoplanes sp. ATCC 53533]RSM55793.1 hypothetical protein DMB66_34940 [Actinoplanes sp. ATCC 53533]
MNLPDDEKTQVDSVRNPQRRHELIERLAVPTFDWASGPIVAMAEALAPSTRAGLSAGRAAPNPEHRPYRWLGLRRWHRSGAAASG